MSNRLFCREKPGEQEWQALADMKIPFLLNYSQCQLLMGNYYEVIEQCSQVLIQQPSKTLSTKCLNGIQFNLFYISDNVKAIFRRGMAHLNAWNPTEAKNDFEVPFT